MLLLALRTRSSRLGAPSSRPAPTTTTTRAQLISSSSSLRLLFASSSSSSSSSSAPASSSSFSAAGSGDEGDGHHDHHDAHDGGGHQHKHGEHNDGHQHHDAHETVSSRMGYTWFKPTCGAPVDAYLADSFHHSRFSNWTNKGRPVDVRKLIHEKTTPHPRISRLATEQTPGVLRFDLRE